MIRVKDWHRFQHFNNRRPIWIKLYRDLLEDPEYHALDCDAAKYLVLIWLIASEDKDKNGGLPDIPTLAWRLRITETKLNSIVPKLSHYLIQDDISVISDGYQNDIAEKSREEIEKRRVDSVRATRFTPPTLQEVMDYCKERGNRVDPIQWHAKYTANGWMVGKNKMRDWKASVVYWERNSGLS